MKLVLHIGSGKTGTTSIQKFFINNSDKLLNHGVFYPVKRSIVPNHILLPAGFVRHGSISTSHNRFYLDSFDRFKKDYEKFKYALDQELQKQKPDVMVLSAEQLFRDFSDKSTVSLKDFLKPYFDEIVVVAYVRDPVSDYASRVSQHIRTGMLMLPPVVRDVRAVLQYYESQFPGCVKVNAFERDQLVEGDVVADFISKYVPEAMSIYIANKPSIQNEGLPVEILLKLQQVRLSFQPEGKRPQIATTVLMSRITKNYLKHYSQKNSGKVILKQEVKDYLESSAVDYVWLRDTYGVTFNSLDYERVRETENKLSHYTLLSDVAIVDQSSLAALNYIVPSVSPMASFIRTQCFTWAGQVMRFYRMNIKHSPLNKLVGKWFK